MKNAIGYMVASFGWRAAFDGERTFWCFKGANGVAARVAYEPVEGLWEARVAFGKTTVLKCRGLYYTALEAFAQAQDDVARLGA